MKEYDLIVVGGGFSGFCSAVVASRKGLKVLLADESNCLGGTASNALVNPFMPYWTWAKKDNSVFNTSCGLFTEIVNELLKNNAILENKQTFDNEYLKLLLNRMAINSNVELLFHAKLLSVDTEDYELKKIKFITNSGPIELTAKYYVDATGDATLSHFAHFPTRLGRDKDHLCQPMTLTFRLGNVDTTTLKTENKSINELYVKYKKEGKIKNTRENVLLFNTMNKGVISFNSTRICKRNPVDPFDLTQAEIEAREQAYELYYFLKDNFKSFRDSEMLLTASHIGIRESRMIDGEYVLKVEDIKSCKRFEDNVACGNYDIDIHSPDGEGTSHYYFGVEEYYNIPYRCLIPKNSRNLLTVGRCISVDHETQASIRIMPIVCTIGEAGGLAIYVAHRHKQEVKNIDVKELQKELLNNGAFLGK